MKLVKARLLNRPGLLLCVVIGDLGNKTVIFDCSKLNDADKKIIGDNRKMLNGLTLSEKIEWSKQHIVNYGSKIKTPFTSNLVILEEYGKFS